MDNRTALDPQNSVVVEACAGSGKTWLLVSRIVRLLLDGVKPGEILAITFTRRAAQEMQARLREWLHLLAVQDDAAVRRFLHERALDDIDAAVLAKARTLYRDALLAQPAITISTFHGWFMQIIQRAPLNAGATTGMQLLERTQALRDEAWQAFAGSLRTAPDGGMAQFMQRLFAGYGLHSTRMLLENFVHKRAEWWAYASGQEDAAGYAIAQLRAEFGMDIDADPIADAGADATLQATVQAFARALATGTETQCNQAGTLQAALGMTDAHQRFAALLLALYTQADEPRSFKPTKKQDAQTFLLARDVLFDKLQAVRDALTERDALRMNEAALHCGAALLEHYQELKLRSQQMDFTDLEWQVCRLLNQSDCAEYLQYKLDSRYKHVLLDEFQDTNPLQWQILQAWFSAAAAVDSRPTVFVVGDPKQSIYRFRRADARLFGVAREFLESEFGARHLTQNETRRNAPAVLDAVNGVFASLPEGVMDFEAHVAHHRDLPGHVEALPLLPLPPLQGEGWGGDGVELRNPLTTPRKEKLGGTREIEAEQFADRIAAIVANWNVQDGSSVRRAEYRDIMVLVRKRTHLRIYERALRVRHIPFLTSRRGGLLDTLEAEDIQALLTFLITPFADLELAQALRSPLFSCTDEDLMQLAGSKGEVESGKREGSVAAPSMPHSQSWWSRLQRMVQSGATSPQLQRAHHLLQSWLQRADKLPVHDLLDRIYFEGDLLHRYAAALPAGLHETAHANLQAFMEIALNVDAGRYPSLPRFLVELNELRAAENESPDEGRVGDAGNALRIYTVHEAKGLEAPIVWLLDANDAQRKTDSYSVLLDWQPNAPRPSHFSLFSDQRGRGAKRAHYFEADEVYAQREEMNLLYVAMTRAKQVLLVSGNGEMTEGSWYQRIARSQGLAQQTEGHNTAATVQSAVNIAAQPHPMPAAVDERLTQPLPTGSRKIVLTDVQRYGIWLHALMERLTLPDRGEDARLLQQQLGIHALHMPALWQQAQRLLTAPQLVHFFDAQHYRAASNEAACVNAHGELRRIDRLVEFDEEVWVLDYKTGADTDPASHTAQLEEYRRAIQTVYPHKTVRCALILGDGQLLEIG